MSNNTAPFEIIAAPFTVWIAPVGTTFPDVDDTPAGSWTKIGTSGDLNYSEDGVTISHPQSIEIIRALGSTGPRKVFRSEEELRVSFKLIDLSLEQYAQAMNNNTVTTVAAGSGLGGFKKIGLSRGFKVEQRALLVKGLNTSAYGADHNAQFELPIVVQVGEPEVVFVKDEPAGLDLEFLVIEDTSAASAAERFGRLVMQNADPA